jgi:paraquat-inducible protein B
VDAHEKPDEPRTRTDVRHAWWPGWIWSVPIAALIVVGWLGVRALTTSGTDITISFDDVHGLSPNGGRISWRGVDVGEVKSVTLAPDGSSVEVSASIERSAAHLLRSDTRFWLHGAHPALRDLSSLGNLFSGPAVIMEPGPGKPARHFTGLAYRPVAPVGSPAPQRFEVTFDGPVGDLAIGDPVVLRGFTVGDVKFIGLLLDPQSGRLSTPVALDLYPSLFPSEGKAGASDAAALRALVDKLVAQGLHARLTRDPPVIGSYRVSLEMEPHANAASAAQGGLPRIPAAAGGGIDSIVEQVNTVPIEQIGQNVLAITRNANRLVSSPELVDAIIQLDAALKQIDSSAARVGAKLDRLVAALQQTASRLDHTAASVDRAMGGSTSQYGVDTAVKEITEAARAARSLADYLDRHPEALIKGRDR